MLLCVYVDELDQLDQIVACTARRACKPARIDLSRDGPGRAYAEPEAVAKRSLPREKPARPMGFSCGVAAEGDAAADKERACIQSIAW